MRINTLIILYAALTTVLCSYAIGAENKDGGLAGSKYLKAAAGYTGSSYSMSGKTDLSALGLGSEIDVDCAVINMGFTPEIAFGYYFTDSVRVEVAASASFLKNTNSKNPVGMKNSSARELDIFLNGYYDFNSGGRFRPYLKLGVGYLSTTTSVLYKVLG